MNSTYKKWISSIFDGTAATYGQSGSAYFNQFAKLLVERVPLEEGMRVLDVAMGRGAILGLAAQKIGHKGLAVGIDISSQMVMETQRAFKSLPHVKVSQMDAECLQYEDSFFDVVFCGFGIFFMPNVHQALLEFKRVLKPKGFLALSTWGPRDLCHTLLRELSHEFGVNVKITVHEFREENQIRTVLEQAGLEEIQIEPNIIDHVYPGSGIHSFWESLWTHGTRGILEQLSTEQQEQLFKDLNLKLQPLLREDGLHEKLLAYLTVAKKPKFPSNP